MFRGKKTGDEHFEWIKKKLEFIEGQNRRLFFSTSTYLGDYTAITWITSGQRIFVDTRDLGISQHLMFKGFWEKTTNEALLRLLSEDSVFVDVGAHLGYHTLTAAQRVVRGSVVAIEPNPRLFSLLEKSVRVNQLRDRVTVHNCAVSDLAGNADFVCPADDPALGHIANESDGEVPEAAARARVRVRTVDELCQDLARIDVLKIDVEGHEWQALHGAEKTIGRSPQIAVVCEYAPGYIERQMPIDEFNGFLRELGFDHAYRIDSSGRLVDVTLEALAEDPSLRNIVLSKRRLEVQQD